MKDPGCHCDRDDCRACAQNAARGVVNGVAIGAALWIAVAASVFALLSL